jgi:hypothetical protein
MLGHYAHPVVWGGYVVAILTAVMMALIGFPDSEGALVALGVGISLMLMTADYFVHWRVHKRAKEGNPLLPFASLFWTLMLTCLLGIGVITSGWQLLVVFVGQAVWDNSWHAVHNHQDPEKPRADLDSPFIRWGTATAVAAAIVIVWMF